MILTRACEILREQSMSAPHDHIRGLVHNMRAQVAQASARAQAVRTRGDASIAEFHAAVQQTEAYLDEVDAAAAEMRGVLQDEGSNGGPALDDLGNSPADYERVGTVLPAGQQAIASAYVNALTPALPYDAPSAPPRIPRGS